MNWSLPELEQDYNRELLDAAEFVGKFLAVGLLFRLMLHLQPDTMVLQEALASLTAGSLGLIGVEAASSGIRMTAEGTTYVMTRDCLGWKSVAAFLGLGFASSRRNVWYAAGGVMLILGLNFFRIITTVMLAGSVSFDLLHTVLWRWGLTLSVLGVWLGWLLYE